MEGHRPVKNSTIAPAVCFLAVALIPAARAQSSCSVTNPTSSTVFLYPQAAQLTLSCTSAPNAYKAIWYVDYSRWAVGFNADQHQAIVDWAEQWQGIPFAVQWQPALPGDGQHSVYAVVQDIYGNTIATTPTVSFNVNIQGRANHTCITTAPPSSSGTGLPCPTTPITTMSGQGYLQMVTGDSQFYVPGAYTPLIDGEPMSGAASQDYFGHYAACGFNETSQSGQPYAIIGDLATWCWPNGSHVFVVGSSKDAGSDPQLITETLPTSGSPSGNEIYFAPATNYPAGHWFYNGEPLVFSGAPPTPLAIGGFACGIGSPSGWHCSSNEITSITASSQTLTVNLNVNPISAWGASTAQTLFVRNLPYTDQTTGQQPCDGQFPIAAVTSSSESFVVPSTCNTATLITNLANSNINNNVELWSNPYCAIYIDKNDIQVSSAFTAIQPPSAPPGSFQCGSALSLTGSYSSTATTAKGRMRSPYWTGTYAGNGSVWGNDFVAVANPPAQNVGLMSLSNGSAGMQFEPPDWEYHGYYGKTGDTLCPGGNLTVLNTDYSTTTFSCGTYGSSVFTFSQDGGVSGAISFNTSTGAITYNATASWSDPAHQSAWAHVTIAGSLCGPSHNATCPSMTVYIENHGAIITFPHWTTCGVIAQAFNSGLPSNCQSFFPRNEWLLTSTSNTYPWQLLEDSNVNSIGLQGYNQGNSSGLTQASSSSCPSFPAPSDAAAMTWAQQYNMYLEGQIYDGIIYVNGEAYWAQGAVPILNNFKFNRQSCLQSLITWMTTPPNNRYWLLRVDDEVPDDIGLGSSTTPNPSPTIANASAPMAAYLPSITSLGVSGGVMTAVVTNIVAPTVWTQSAGTGNAFQLAGLTANSGCNGWYLISSVTGSGPYTITAAVPSYLSSCTASSIRDSGGVLELPSSTNPVVTPNAGMIPANPGQGCSQPNPPSGNDCQALSSSIYITTSGSTATVTWPGHNLTSGQVIRIWHGSTANLNTIAPITVTGTNSFTFQYPGGTGGAAPSCSPCNNSTDPNAYITVDPGFGASLLNSLWSIIDGVANAPAHCYSLFGVDYGGSNAFLYNWIGNPANVNCAGVIYTATAPTPLTEPDETVIQAAGWGSFYYPVRPLSLSPRVFLTSHPDYSPFQVSYCPSIWFNPACDKPALSGWVSGLSWAPELPLVQVMQSKIQGNSGVDHYRGGSGIQGNFFKTCCGWSWTGQGGINYGEPVTSPRSWNGVAHTYALLQARQSTELQPEANKPYLNNWVLTDAHTSSTYGNETTAMCISSYHCGAQALALNPISGGSLILYLTDGYTLRVYTSATMSALAGNPSSITPPSGDWGISPITGQQSPGLTWVFVSLPANYTPLDSITFAPPAALPFRASKFLIQVGYYPEDMRADPVTDCTSTCIISIDHHNLNAWYRVIYANTSAIPMSIGEPVQVPSQGLY